MRVALFSDIHGHVTGLQAVLARLKWLGGADLVCCVGDILGGGPGLDDVLDLLLEHNALLVRGNWDEIFMDLDAYLAHLRADDQDKIRRLYDWMASSLSSEYQTLLASLPLNQTVEIGSDQRLFLCHAAPDDTRARVCEPATPAAILRKTFGSVDAQVIAYGHYHNQHILRLDGANLGDKLLLNVASVGLGWKGLSTLTLLEQRNGSVSIQQFQVPYDFDEHLRLIKERGMPTGREFYYWDDMQGDDMQGDDTEPRKSNAT